MAMNFDPNNPNNPFPAGTPSTSGTDPAQQQQPAPSPTSAVVPPDPASNPAAAPTTPTGPASQEQLASAWSTIGDKVSSAEQTSDSDFLSALTSAEPPAHASDQEKVAFYQDLQAKLRERFPAFDPRTASTGGTTTP